MVELLSKADRDALDKADNSKDGESSKKKGSASSKSYILRSVLDEKLIEAANTPDVDIRRDEPQPLEDAEAEKLSEGSILAWPTSDHVGNMGLMHVILALILVHGKELPDSKALFPTRESRNCS